MDTKSVVRIERPNTPSTNMVGKFSIGRRIQKLTAPARELIESTTTLRRLYDYLFRDKGPGGLEIARSLRKQTPARFQEIIKFIEKQIQAELKKLLVEPVQKLCFSEKILIKPKVSAKPRHGLFLALDPPQLFVAIPNKTELGGCARSDSLVRPLIF